MNSLRQDIKQAILDIKEEELTTWYTGTPNSFNYYNALTDRIISILQEHGLVPYGN